MHLVTASGGVSQRFGGPATRFVVTSIIALLFLLATLVLPTALWPSSAVAATAACQPDTSTGCLGGTLRTSAGDPATDVVLTVEGPGGTFEAVSDEAGRWSVALTEEGEYTVLLDVETLPDGEQLRDPGQNPRTSSVALGSSAGALFPMVAEGSTVTPQDPATTADPDAPVDTDVPAGDDELAGDPIQSPTGRTTGDRVLQMVVSGLIFGLLLALASVGLSLIYGTTGLSNFSHAELVTLGGIVAYVAAQWWGMPLWAAGLISLAVGALMGFVQNAILWEPMRRRRVGITQQMIVTIGLAMVLQYSMLIIAGEGTLRIVTSNPQVYVFGPVRLTQQSLFSVIIAIAVLAAVAYVLLRTRIGRATRAVSDNPALAAASGIKVESIVRLVWVSGAALAALGGTLMGLYLNSTQWNMGARLLLLMFAAVTLGGLGHAMGALVGSIVIGLVVELSPLLLPSDMRYASALFILILVLLLRPQGILGRAERVG